MIFQVSHRCAKNGFGEIKDDSESNAILRNWDNDFAYRKELEALKKRHPEFKIDYVVSADRIDEKTIPKLVPDMDNPLFYVSGPEPMVESLDKTLKNSAFQKIG
jgi:ferredoxin-NADP reductase